MPGNPNLAYQLAVVAFLGALSPVAVAQSPADDVPLSPYVTHALRAEVVGGAGFGRATIATSETVNTYGPAIGLRLGYTFPFPLHLGLRYEHFFGTSEQYPVPLVAMTKYHAGASFLGAAVGAELLIGPAYLRPEVGLGAIVLRSSATCSPVAGSFSDLASQMCAANKDSSASWAPAIAPGLVMGLRLDRVHAFVEPAYYLRKSASAYAILGGVGVAF